MTHDRIRRLSLAAPSCTCLAAAGLAHLGAKTTDVESSHVPFSPRPREVARLIGQAANAAAA